MFGISTPVSCLGVHMGSLCCPEKGNAWDYLRHSGACCRSSEGHHIRCTLFAQLLQGVLVRLVSFHHQGWVEPFWASFLATRWVCTTSSACFAQARDEPVPLQEGSLCVAIAWAMFLGSWLGRWLRLVTFVSTTGHKGSQYYWIICRVVFIGICWDNIGNYWNIMEYIGDSWSILDMLWNIWI